MLDITVTSTDGVVDCSVTARGGSGIRNQSAQDSGGSDPTGFEIGDVVWVERVDTRLLLSENYAGRHL